MKKVFFLICCLCFFLFSGNVYANPVGLPLRLFTSSHPEMWALLVEAIVVGLLVARYKARFVWFIFLWFPLTCITFLFFLIYLGIFWYASLDVLGIRSILIFCFIAIIGEMGIVVFEARLLMGFSKLRFIRNIFQGPMKMKRALLISLVGNIASILAYPVIISIIYGG